MACVTARGSLEKRMGPCTAAASNSERYAASRMNCEGTSHLPLIDAHVNVSTHVTHRSIVSDGLQPTGVGAWYYSDGSWYKGPLHNGGQHGHGEFRAANGSGYVGDWVNGQRSGKGELRSAVSATTKYFVYTGEWLEDQQHGFGKLIEKERGAYSEEQTEFEGQWRKGVRHGRGKLIMSNGDIFEGEWQNDK